MQMVSEGTNSRKVEEARFYEELALNMWPSLQTYHYDGWVLRFANNLSRRANCVVPIYRSTEPLEEKVEQCRDLFERVGIVPAFKIFPSADGIELERLLESLGYDRCFETRILARELEGFVGGGGREGRGLVGRGGREGREGGVGRGGGTGVRQLATEEWCREYIRLSGKRDAETLYGIVSNIRCEHYLCALTRGGEICAVGIAVFQRGNVGLQGIVVDARMRGEGLGATITEALLSWGREMGARCAYLQVESDNEAALRLYDRLDFEELYRYWYRCTEVPAS